MKYLKKYEYASYLNLHGDDNYDIEEVKRDKNHDYEYCDGVLYVPSKKTQKSLASVMNLTSFLI